MKMRFASKDSEGNIERNADGSIKHEYGGYEQVNYLYDRNLVLSRSEFRSLAHGRQAYSAGARSAFTHRRSPGPLGPAHQGISLGFHTWMFDF